MQTIDGTSCPCCCSSCLPIRISKTRNHHIQIHILYVYKLPKHVKMKKCRRWHFNDVFHECSIADETHSSKTGTQSEPVTCCCCRAQQGQGCTLDKGSPGTGSFLELYWRPTLQTYAVFIHFWASPFYLLCAGWPC